MNPAAVKFKALVGTSRHYVGSSGDCRTCIQARTIPELNEQEIMNDHKAAVGKAIAL